MENHPIPQDITSFQFKLIGNMTVRQFAYFAAGVILGWIFLSLPILPFIKFPLAFLFLILGFSLAFIPVEGRPFDTVISLFIKSLFAPNQYVFQKTGGQILRFDLPQKQQAVKEERRHGVSLQTFLQTMPKTPKNKLDEKELGFFNEISKLLAANNAQQSQDDSGLRILSINEEAKKSQEQKFEDREENIPQEKSKATEDLEKKEEIIKKELEEAKQEETAPQKGEAPQTTHERVLLLERQLNEVLAQRARLKNEVLELQKKIETQKTAVFTPSEFSTAQEPLTQTQNVKNVPKAMGKSIGVPIGPDVPNLVMGIIKDPRGNVLSNIIVEIKDSEGNPVRAFKTNALGQFASATPLLNGVYTISFEDPEGKNKFDSVQLNTEGEIISVIEVTSVDAREELRKALFN